MTTRSDAPPAVQRGAGPRVPVLPRAALPAGLRPVPVTLATHRARRHIGRITAWHLAISVPTAVAVEVLHGVPTMLPYVVLTVAAYLALIAPAVRRPHLPAATAALTAIPVAGFLATAGTDRVALVGLLGGAVFLLEGATDVVVATRIARRTA